MKWKIFLFIDYNNDNKNCVGTNMQILLGATDVRGVIAPQNMEQVSQKTIYQMWCTRTNLQDRSEVGAVVKSLEKANRIYPEL